MGCLWLRTRLKIKYLLLMTCYAPNLQWERGKGSFRPHPTPKLFFFIYCAVDYHFFIGIGHGVPGCCIRQSKHWEGKGMHERRVDNQWGALSLAKIWFSEWCNPYFSDSWSIFWYVMRGFICSQPQHIAWASFSLIDTSIFSPFYRPVEMLPFPFFCTVFAFTGEVS